MSKAYKGADYRIQLDTNDTDSATASPIQMKYIRPDGTRGTWSATTTGTTELYYDITTVPVSGDWRFNAYYTTSGGKVRTGETYTHHFYNEGE